MLTALREHGLDSMPTQSRGHGTRRLGRRTQGSVPKCQIKASFDVFRSHSGQSIHGSFTIKVSGPAIMFRSRLANAQMPTRPELPKSHFGRKWLINNMLNHYLPSCWLHTARYVRWYCPGFALL